MANSTQTETTTATSGYLNRKVRTYDEAAVDREIKKDRRIKGREARATHALLKGRV